MNSIKGILLPCSLTGTFSQNYSINLGASSIFYFFGKPLNFILFLLPSLASWACDCNFPFWAPQMEMSSIPALLWNNTFY